MIKPFLKDTEFLADVEAARIETGSFHLWWLGQSGFLIQWNSRHLLLDPYLSDSLTQKYAGTDKPHVRMTERVVAPEQLDFIDVVTSSHSHTDHLDPGTLRPLSQASPRFELVVPESSLALARERAGAHQGAIHGIDAGRSATFSGFTVHAVPAAHETVEKDEQGRCCFLGYVIQFGRWTLYHSGDTMLYEGMAGTLRRWSIDVALLPINGRAPERRVAGNLTGPEAAQLAKDISARLVIPCHYDMFEFNTASPDEFARTADRLGQACKVLRAGERWSSSALRTRSPA